MVEKKCNSCNLIKLEKDFKSKNICKVCHTQYKKRWYIANKERILKEAKVKYQNDSIEIKKRVKKYRKDNPEKVKNLNASYYKNNKTLISNKNKQYAKDNKEIVAKRKKDWASKNKEHLKEKNKNYYLNNKEHIKELHDNRMINDNVYAITVKTRKLILKSFRQRSYEKPNKTTKILGCSFEEFKNHLEKQFKPWMNWTNRGLYNGEMDYGWDIDHIIELSTAKTEKDVIRLNHYTNLQPLCGYINRNVKGKLK